MALALLFGWVVVVKEDEHDDVVVVIASLARSTDVRGVVDVERDILGCSARVVVDDEVCNYAG